MIGFGDDSEVTSRRSLRILGFELFIDFLNSSHLSSLYATIIGDIYRRDHSKQIHLLGYAIEQGSKPRHANIPFRYYLKRYRALRQRYDKT